MTCQHKQGISRNTQQKILFDSRSISLNLRSKAVVGALIELVDDCADFDSKDERRISSNAYSIGVWN